ncbi:LysE family translocator [Clostridium sp. DJ247]|uniref:LysE family translocator n=1 Tax=Clostridium sp. DJ247 TaxID=2726188 RepID=UPI001626F397|nr:LysE family transporter [Clostridium sp. DJ247]MBC2580958.1 LysE family transporter [Clostridium sp. DJ247]
MKDFSIILRVILSGFFIGVIISIPLGPAGIESVKKTLSDGYKNGIVFILGSLMADLVYMFLLDIGLASIFINQTEKENLYYWIISGLILIIANYFFNKRKKHEIKKRTYNNSYIISYLSGFVLTFLNPASITVWLTLSAIYIAFLDTMTHSYYFIFLWSAWLGMVAWFFILNYLAVKGFELLRPSKKERKNHIITRTLTIVTDNSMTIMGVGFIFYGVYRYMLK